MKKWVLILVMSVAFLSGYKKADEKPVVVYAAAGTAPAMKEIAALFEKQTGKHVVFNFANAGVLAKQLSSGASADLFFSANEKWMNFAAGKKLVQSETREDLLTNRLVVVVPKGRSLAVDFTTGYSGCPFCGRLAVGDSVTPVGMYAEQAFTKLGWWHVVKPHMCVGDTVQKVLNYVALGEADAGVVFQSVAACSADKVDVVGLIPGELHKPIRFPVAACNGVSADGLQFLDFMRSEAAAEVFERFGWSVISREKVTHEHV